LIDDGIDDIEMANHYISQDHTTTRKKIMSSINKNVGADGYEYITL